MIGICYSLVMNISNSYVKVVSIPGGNIFVIEKAINVDLPKEVIMHIGANDVSQLKNRSEEHVNKI